jgi:CheY-like chemotaxis protein/nitrogen-specific signal transduction histidine kinase
MGMVFLVLLVALPIISILLIKVNKLNKQVDELVALSVESEQRIKAKANFLATMSHEIRTPLNGIIVASKLLREKELDSEMEDMVDIINNSGDLLIGVVNDILDFSKIESGKLELDFAAFDIREVVKNVVFSFKKQFEDKGIYLRFDIREGIPFYYYSDEIRLKQVLFNLISNAYKFTEKGGVTLFIDYDKDSSNLSLNVSDTGIGIEQEKIEQLFDEYTQESSKTFKQFGGTGLGLSITKSLTELLGGSINVKSEKGMGTTFHVVIEAQEMKGPKQEKSVGIEEADFSNLEVLVVDDNPINRKVAIMTFKKHGISPDEAVDGEEAVQAAMNKVYDIIYMDIHMPNKNGLEASEELIEKIPYSQLPLIYALSANAFKENKDACFNAGMSGFISKPITLERLDESLSMAYKKKLRRSA